MIERSTSKSFERAASHEVQRLMEQDALIRPFTVQLLQAAGVREGMRVVDLGCGAGDSSLLAAEMVGPTGRVVGIDLNADKIEFCRDRAEAEGRKNVAFEVHAIEDFAEGMFDIALGRYLLMHCDEPVEIVRQAIRLVAPGGVIAFHEIDLLSDCTSTPPSDLFDGEAAKIVAAPRAYLPSPEAPRHLVDIFEKAGLPRPQTLCSRPTAGQDPMPFARWFAGFASKAYAYFDADADPLDIDAYATSIFKAVQGRQVVGHDQWMAWASPGSPPGRLS